MLEDCMDPSVFLSTMNRSSIWFDEITFGLIIRRQEEEFITELVPIESEWIESQESFLGDRTLEDVLRRSIGTILT